MFFDLGSITITLLAVNFLPFEKAVFLFSAPAESTTIMEQPNSNGIAGS